MMAATDLPSSQSNTVKSYKKADRKAKKQNDSIDESTAALRGKFEEEYNILRPVFPEWKEADLLAILEEVQGDIHLASNRISEGFAEQWSDVSAQKRQKKPSANSTSSSFSESTKPRVVKESTKEKRARTAPATRGGRGGFKGSRGRGGFAGTRSTRATEAGAAPVDTVAIELIEVASLKPVETEVSTSKQATAKAPVPKMSWAAIVKPVPEPEPEQPLPKKTASPKKEAASPKKETVSKAATPVPSEAPISEKPSPVRASPAATKTSEVKKADEEQGFVPSMPPGLGPKSNATAAAAARKTLKQDSPVVMPAQQQRAEVSAVEMQFGTLRLGENREEAVSTSNAYGQFGNQIIGGNLKPDSSKLNYLKTVPQQAQPQQQAAVAVTAAGHSATHAPTAATGHPVSSQGYTPQHQTPAALAAAAAAYGMPQYGYYPYANMYQFPGYQNSMYANQFAAAQQHMNPSHMGKNVYAYGTNSAQQSTKPASGVDSTTSTLAPFNNVNAAALYNNIYGMYAANGSTDEASALAAAAAAQLQSLGMHPSGVLPNMQHPQFAQLQHFANMSGAAGSADSKQAGMNSFGAASGKAGANSYDKFAKTSNTPSAANQTGSAANEHHHHHHQQSGAHQAPQQNPMSAYSNFGQYSGHQSHGVNGGSGGNMQNNVNANTGFSMRNYWASN